MSRFILAINAGSSTLKLGVFRADADGLRPEFRARMDNGEPSRRLQVRRESGQAVAGPKLRLGRRSLAATAPEAIAWCEAELGAPLDAIGHRIVHGGAAAGPLVLTEAVLRDLDALSPLAPVHQPPSLAAIAGVRRARPNLPQVAAFDTAFHYGHAAVVARPALPEPYASTLRRYGFHGLSYEHVAGRLQELEPAAAGGRVVAAHLGSGASLCALLAGRSVDTTMGATPLDGLLMATRCGSLDPGAVLYLQQAQGLSADAVTDLLYRRSGLLGVSGVSGDMRVLLELETSDPRAREAIELFVFRAARDVGSLAATLGGLDALVFTGGIGENAAAIRARIGARLAWLGVDVDEDAPGEGERRISAGGSRVAVWVIPTDEERVIARRTCDALGLGEGEGKRA